MTRINPRRKVWNNMTNHNETPAVTATAGTYIVDPKQASIRFTTRHMFGLSGVTGSFALNSARIVVADPPTGSTVTANASAASFSTGMTVRDRKVHSKTFLNVESFPDISFRSVLVRKNDEGWVVAGTLTARGQQSPIELLVTSVAGSANSLTFVAHGRIDRYAHGITAMKGIAGRHLDIEITSVATRTT
jgi:polyisoprenoid-binding protein YceI